MQVVNAELEKLEGKDVKIGGKSFDLWSLRKDIILYGSSLEGDDYITAPLFFNPGDAILHSLNPMFIKDTVGLATNDFPANTDLSKNFRFNSGLRLRVYILDSQAFYYDARGKVRLNCEEVGSPNFKINYLLRLPTGTKSNVKIQGLGAEQILRNIVDNNQNFPNDSSVNQLIRVEAFHFCAPGKYLKVQKSFKIDMSKLWLYYANGLNNGYDPNRIRSSAFLGDEKSKNLINSLLSDVQTPTAIGAISRNIASAIENGESLNELLSRCASSTINQNVCVSGPFYKLLWNRDVLSIITYFDTKDPGKFIVTKVKNPMVEGWVFKEDFNPDIGYADIAYNINYNRFLDINTTICWIIRNLRQRNLLISNASYNMEKNEEDIQYRFTDKDLDRFVRIVVYDADNDLKLDLTFGENQLNLTLRNVSGSERAKIQLPIFQKFLEELFSSAVVKFKLQTNRFEHKMENSIILFPATATSNEKIPSNWYVLQITSSLLRYLIKYQDFNFFSFQ